MKNKTAFLFAGGTNAEPAITLGQGLPTEVNGLKASYYWRQTLKDGYYKHPVAGWEMVVTPDYRKELAASFHKMKEAGLDVPVVRKHDGLRIGGVFGVKNDGPWLYELHQYLGEPNQTDALTNFVSPGIDEHFIDTKGRAWGKALFHSAIVPDPVVTGQGEAIRIMSSSGQHDTIDVLTLADSTGDAAMSVIQLSQEQFDKIKAAMGGGDNVTPDNFVESITTTLSAHAQAVEVEASKLLSITAERDEARTKLSDAESKVREFSASATRQPDAFVMNERATVASEAIAILRDAGNITPACADALTKALVADNKPNVRLLSADAGEVPAYKPILAALKLNKVMQFGNAANLQILNPSTEEPKTAEQREADLEAELKRRLARIGQNAA